MSKTNKIFKVRKISGLTRQQVSDLFHIPASTLTDWELERRQPPEYVEEMVIEKMERYHMKQKILSETKEEVFFPKLKKMDYMDGVEYLLSCGYEKNDRYEAEDDEMILVSEYWKMTLPESDFYYDPDESNEYNSSTISWEYKFPANQLETVKDKWNGYWNEVSSIGEE